MNGTFSQAIRFALSLVAGFGGIYVGGIVGAIVGFFLSPASKDCMASTQRHCFSSSSESSSDFAREFDSATSSGRS